MNAWTIALVVFIVGFGGSYAYYHPLDNAKWCERNMPQFNTSLTDENVAYCYGEGWQEYCKVSYPDHCPKMRGRE